MLLYADLHHIVRALEQLFSKNITELFHTRLSFVTLRHLFVVLYLIVRHGFIFSGHAPNVKFYKKRIHIIDDDHDIPELLKIVFRDSRNEVIFSQTALDISYIDVFHPDLILLEV